MFTGIVQAVGTVEALRPGDRERVLRIRSRPVRERLAVGDSVALDGVCQTVISLSPDAFEVQAMAETLRVTTLGRRQVGDRLNLETALTPSTPLGGHFVQGHVDGVATLVSREPVGGESLRLRFAAEPALVEQLVPKGSVAIDGISLTVGPQTSRGGFEIYCIPLTLAVTTLGQRRPGDPVNVETDILGKYVLSLLRAGRGAGEGLSWETLRAAGFLASGEGEEG